MKKKLSVPVVWKIAVRNLIEHKTKTLIIGAIVAVGVLVLILGNAVLDTATAGIQENYIENFTGDVILSGATEDGITFFPFEQVMADSSESPITPDYFELETYLDASDMVASWSPLISGMATIMFSDDIMMPTQVFGVDIEKYREVFPDNMELLDGRLLTSGESGIMLSTTAVALFKQANGRNPEAGDMIELMAMTDRAGMKIDELPYVGTFAFRNAETNPMLPMICMTDYNSLRSMLGMNLAEETVVLSAEEESIIGGFSDNDIFSSAGDSGDGLFADVMADEGTNTAETLFAEIGDRSGVEALYLADSGEWNFVTIKLAGGVSSKTAITTFAEDFTSAGWDIQVNTWLDGAGGQARMTYTLKTVFNVIILIIVVVAVIIIMNTLVVSITERIPEIGTIRAIGGRKSFVRKMIVSETFMITLVFGIIGILGAVLILAGLNARGLHFENIFLRMLLGGSVLNPVISIKTLVLDLAGIVVIGAAASLYPTAVALRIHPVTAMQSN